MSFDHRKYAPFPTIDKPDRQWPSKRIEKAPYGRRWTCATATRR